MRRVHNAIYLLNRRYCCGKNTTSQYHNKNNNLEYIVVHEFSQTEFVKKVQVYLDNDYELQGGVSVTTGDWMHLSAHFYQALIKNK